jgi:5-methylcytosine-specific restriction endonuclease McrA
MENMNICATCHEPGRLILCDKCPRAFHKRIRCLGDVLCDEVYGAEEEDPFICGHCDIPISKTLRKRDNEYLNMQDIRDHCKEVKEEIRFNYKYTSIYRGRARETQRKASGSSSIRARLCRDQGDSCAGLLKESGRYESCGHDVTDCDHIVELRHGGDDDITNLQMLCHDCHLAKTAANYHGQVCY